MGDRRFEPFYARIRDAPDRSAALRELSDSDVIGALAAASRANDPLLANVLATEAQNRTRRAAAITTHLGEGVIALDRGWRITMFNPAAERILGWSSQEAIGRELHETIHPFCAQPARCRLGRLPRLGEQFQNDDALLLHKDGRTVPAAYTVTALSNEEDVEGGIVVFRDMRERREIEEIARDQTERLERVLEASRVGLLIVDVQGRITFANGAAEGILGRGRRDIAQRTYFDPVWGWTGAAGEPLPVTELPFRRVFLTGVGIADVELGLARRGGARRRVSLSVAPLADPSGEVHEVVVSLLDVTERVRAQEELAAARSVRDADEERFRALVESAPDALVIVDDRGRISLVNRQAELLFGYAREELVGRSVETLVPERFREAHEEDRERFSGEPRTRRMASGMPLAARRKDGSEFRAEIALGPVRTSQGLLIAATIREVAAAPGDAASRRAAIEG